VIVRGVPWWGVVSSAAAPVLMITGWTIAAGLQPSSFDQVSQPVSALAAVGATDRWVMTLTFLVVGACDVVTALALRPAVSAGAVVVLLGLVAWFATELISYGGQAGLAERIFGIAQGLWPLAVVVSCRYAAASRIPDLSQPAARPELEPAAGD
jgi:Protein of unknown function (DUF998)